MFGNIAGRLEPVVRILGHHRRNDFSKSLGNIGTGFGDLRRRLGLVPHQPLGQCSLVERRTAGQQEIHRTTETVDVRPGIHLVAVESLFGCQVVGGAQHLFVMPQRDRVLVGLFKEPRQAQVENLDDPLEVHQQVGRLDVAMDQPGLVSVGEPVSRLADVVGGVTVAAGPIVHDQVLQAVPLDILHHQEVDLGRPVHFAINIVGPDDVRVVQRRHRLGFAMESFQVTRVVDLLVRQHLDRTPPPHQHVFGQVHRTHPAFAQQGLQAVLAQEKALVLSLEQLVGLPFGQRLGRDQCISDRLRIATGRQRGNQLLQPVSIHQATLPDQVQKRLDGELQRHAVFPWSVPTLPAQSTYSRI